MNDIVKRILTLLAHIAWLCIRLETLRLFKRLRRPRYCVTLTIITLYAVFMLTHPDNTGPPQTLPPHKSVNAPPITSHRPTFTPAPTFTPMVITTAPTPTPTPYNKALNDRVAAALKRGQTAGGYGTGGYNTGGRRTTLESDQGGAATREFSQQDGITFLDDNTFTGNVKHITPFDPTRPATPTK